MFVNSSMHVLISNKSKALASCSWMKVPFASVSKRVFVQPLFTFPKNNLTKQNILTPSRGLFTMSDYKALDINIEARVKLPEGTWHQTVKA